MPSNDCMHNIMEKQSMIVAGRCPLCMEQQNQKEYTKYQKDRERLYEESERTSQQHYKVGKMLTIMFKHFGETEVWEKMEKACLDVSDYPEQNQPGVLADWQRVLANVKSGIYLRM